MRRDLEIELLRVFVAIADTGGFTRAAERLHRTQSAVSLQMKRLEEAAQTPLFRSQGRQRHLTGAGEQLLSYARRILELHDEAADAIRERSLSGEVRLGASQGLAEGSLPQMLGRFSRAYPSVHLNVRVASSCEMLEALHREELDVALVMQEKGNDDGQVIGFEDLVWIAPQQFQWAPNTPLPLIVFEPPCLFRQLGIKALDTAGIPWRIVYTSPSLPGVMAAVRGGLGVTVRTQYALTEGTRVMTRSQGVPKLPSIAMALHKRSQSPVADLLEETILKTPLSAA